MPSKRAGVLFVFLALLVAVGAMAGQITIMPGSTAVGTDPFVSGQPDPDCLGPTVPKSLTNSTVVLSAGSPDVCWTPGTSQTFCFQTDTFTPDWEYVYTLWLRFPSDWTVTNVTVDGSPSCTGGGSWGTFSWAAGATPNEAVINHARYQMPTDHCTTTYCVTVTTGAGSGDAPVSWYWDGDGYGGAPHNPCSSDGYTPAGQAACDQAVNPPALIPSGGLWTTVSTSAPPAWNGNGYPCSGCTAQNGAAQWVTYLIGDTTSFGGFWGYNHATNAWFNPGAAGTPSNRWAPSWAYDSATNRCYITGGATAPGGGNITQAYMFDPVANSFSALPSFTTARAFHGSWVGTIDGTKYLAIGGGVDASSNVWTSTQCYNLDTLPGAWTAENATMGPYPVGKWGAAYGRLAGPGGSQFWVASGADTSFALNDTAHYFDDADNLWHAAGNTGALVYRTSGTVSGSDFYIVGGSTGGFSPTSSVWKYSGATWGAAPSMPHARMDLVTGVGASGNIWVVDGYGTGGANYVDYLTSCGGGCPTITLNPTTLPGGIVGTYYSSGWINASGGTAAYSLAVLSGALPPGISIHQVSATDFELIGTPTAAGTTTFALEATDMNGCKGSQEYTVEMVCPTITLSPLPSPILNVPYTQTIMATGGTGPYAFALTAGALPVGFNLAADGTLTGTLITLGTYSFTVTATDTLGCTGELAYTIGTFSTFFLDDAGRSKLCVNRLTGAYTWEILVAPGVGVYTGVANILNGGTKIYSKPGAPEYLNCTYDPIRKRASGYFMTAAGDYSRLTDLNTANNPGGCP